MDRRFRATLSRSFVNRFLAIDIVRAIDVLLPMHDLSLTITQRLLVLKIDVSGTISVPLVGRSGR